MAGVSLRVRRVKFMSDATPGKGPTSAAFVQKPSQVAGNVNFMSGPTRGRSHSSVDSVADALRTTVTCASTRGSTAEQPKIFEMVETKRLMERSREWIELTGTSVGYIYKIV